MATAHPFYIPKTDRRLIKEDYLQGAVGQAHCVQYTELHTDVEILRLRIQPVLGDVMSKRVSTEPGSLQQSLMLASQQLGRCIDNLRNVRRQIVANVVTITTPAEIDAELHTKLLLRVREDLGVPRGEMTDFLRDIKAAEPLYRAAPNVGDFYDLLVDFGEKWLADMDFFLNSANARSSVMLRCLEVWRRNRWEEEMILTKLVPVS